MIKLVTFVLAAVLVLVIYKVLSGNSVRWYVRQRMGPLICRLRGHRRAARHVRKMGTLYASRCAVCGIRMEKDGKLGEWKPAASFRSSMAPAAEDGSPMTVAEPRG